MQRDHQTARQYKSGDPNNKGYMPAEAQQFIEFCVELNHQIDRMTAPDDARYIAQIDPALWNPIPIYDSRYAVARDLVSFIETGETKENKGWAKLYRETLDRASDNPPAAWTPNALAADARYNGFGPYQAAWLLYEGRGENAGAYAVAIRGTVFASLPSVVADVLLHPVAAKQFLSPSVSFASFERAALHSGFAHTAFSLLLDERYGILPVLNSTTIQPGARLYIVGHSQGASLATLTHAFLHYAMKDATAANDVFGLHWPAGTRFKLKSYAYAQPKPGNFAFAADFANITQDADNAIVVNNDIDPVPQVPLTLQAVGDLDGHLPRTSIVSTVLRYLGSLGVGFRGLIGRVAEPFVKENCEGYGYFFNYEKLGRLGKNKTASSWNFVPAGRVLMVYGTPDTSNDAFRQHHPWTYRNLVRTQLLP